MKTKYLSVLAAVCVCAAWVGCASQKTPKSITTIPGREVRIQANGSSSLPEPAAGRVFGGNSPALPVLGDEPALGWQFGEAFTGKGVEALRERVAEEEKRRMDLAAYAGEELWVIYRPESEGATDDQ